MPGKTNRALLALAITAVLLMGLVGWWIGGMWGAAANPLPVPRPDAGATVTAGPVATRGAAVPVKPPTAYAPDNDGFVHNWLVLDPIPLKDDTEHSEAVEKPMFAKEYFKDQLKVRPKADDKVIVSAGDLEWREVKLDAATSQIDLAQFAQDHNQPTESVLFWGLTYIVAADDMTNVKLAIGSDDSSVWWVNGEEVIRVYDGRACTADDNVSKAIALKKGVNEVRFAVINGDGPSGACARFLDAQDKPVTKFVVNVEAPAGK